MKKLLEMLMLSALLCGSANAGLMTNYNLVLHINSVVAIRSIGLNADCTPEGFPPDSSFYFGCLSPGDTFTGHFSVDTAILASDGINNTAPIYDFFLPFGKLIYAQGPDNTSLVGFRNGIELGADAPGFVILNGEVTELIGGPYGAGDEPFIVFTFPGEFPTHSNTFNAGDSVELAYGTYSVDPVNVPDPSTLMLFALGTASLLWFRKQRRTNAR